MKILAIDIGSAQIKSILLETKFHRFDIIRHDITDIEGALEEPIQGMLSNGQIQALKKIWQEYQDQVDKVITNIPYNFYTCRILNFPFSDKKKIISGTPFQIEDEVPFDLDKCIISTQIFPNRGSSETQVLAGVAPKDDLKNFIRILEEQTGIRPDILTTQQSACYAFLDRNPSLYQNKSIAIIQLGHHSSSIYIFRDRIPVLSRTSMVGGYDITHTISKNYKISLAEAELAKINSGFLAPPGIEQTNEQKMFSDLISMVLEPIFHDFYQCLMAYSSRYRDRVSQIYLAGGTALLPGTADYLAARWQIPIHPFKVSSQLPNISIHPTANTDMIISNAILLGVSQVENRNKETQNFRTGELRKQGGGFQFQINFKAIEKPLKLFAAVYAFVVISLLIQSFLLTSQLEKKDLRLEAAIRRVFNNPKSSTLYLLKSDSEKMRKEATAKVTELKSQIAGNLEDPTFSPLTYLKQMSETIKKSNTVEIRQISMNPNSIKIKLESPTQNEVDTAIDAIKRIKNITSASEPIRETLPNKNKTASVEFKIKVKGI